MTAPIQITVPKDLTFLPRVNGCFATTPAINIEGYCMEFLHLPKGVEYPLLRKTVSISVLEGALENPELKKYETGYYPTREARGGIYHVKAAAETLLLLAYDTTEMNELREMQEYIRGPILGPRLEWVDVEKKLRSKKGPEKRYRTDPKIEIVGTIAERDVHWRMNLWYLVANLNGGIHDHADGSPPFKEFHVQLIGNGTMVKYRGNTTDTEHERYPMHVGKGHELFCTEKEGKIRYPWHAYVTGNKGAVFVALEEVLK